MAVGIGAGTALTGFCLGGTSRQIHSPFTWKALVIFAIGISAQVLFARYYKARTAFNERLCDFICGLIFGTANAFMFWG